MSDELDPEVVNARWAAICDKIDEMIGRVSDPSGFQEPAPGSSLAGDDAASSPYQVSHAVRSCLVSGVDHLHALKVLVIDGRVLHNHAPFSLARGALENLAAAYWILHPSNRNSRITRALCWHAQNFYDQNTALKPLGRSDDSQRDAKLAKLYSVAAVRGISTASVRRTISTEMVTYADILFAWQLCSGFAHGRPWAYLGLSEREHLPTSDPAVVNLKLTNDLQRLLFPTSEAHQLLVRVERMFGQRSMRHV